MELKKIKFKNFRQFLDEQMIEFALGQENITVIFGENGKGKTGIFRALVFGLFGLTKLPQDDPNTKLHLVNLVKLNESEGKPVEATIEIEFSHNNMKCSIKRTIVALRNKKVIEEKTTNQELNIFNSSTGEKTTITEEREIKEAIKLILNEEIKDFFLFDGEKIEALAKTNLDSRKDIKKGITKLLQIESLEKGVTILRDLHNKQDRKIRSESSNNNLKKIGLEVEKLEEIVKESCEKKEEIIIEKNRCLSKIEEIQLKLEENKDIKNIQREINQLTKDIKNQKALFNEKRNIMKKNILIKSYPLFLENTFANTEEYLNQIYYTQKDNIPIGIIEKILKEGKCICGTDVTQVKEAFKEIEKLKNNYERSNLTSIISKIKDSYHDFMNEKEDISNGIKESLSDIKGLKNQMLELELKKESLSDEIKELSKKERDLEELEKSLESQKKKYSIYNFEIKNIERNIEESVKKLEKTKIEYQKSQDSDESLRKAVKKLQYINDLKINFEKIFEKYTSNMREKLEQETTEIFKKIIDAKDREVISKISITKNYEIEIINWNGIKITQDISQGQRQMVALSFVTALAKVASGNEKNINFPLFMDTPFGRVSGSNRDNLIDNIPNLTSQWILLLTDTEYTATEEMRLKATDKLGAMYRLDQVAPGITQIKKLSISENLATRREV